MDFETRLAFLGGHRDELEKSWIRQTDEVDEQKQWDLTVRAFPQALQMTGEWIEHIRSLGMRRRNNLIYQSYWQGQNKKVGFRI